MQDAVDLHRRDRGTLQRRQQDAPEPVAERHAVTALQRLGHDAGEAGAVSLGRHFELVRLDEFLPVLFHDTDCPV